MIDLINAIKAYSNTAVQKQIKQNIKNNRCLDFELTLKDSSGNTVNNSVVEVKQVASEFKFGANCFMLDELETEQKNKAYKDAFKNLFNIATIPFYWDTLEPTRGKPRFKIGCEKIYRRPAIDLAIEYCKNNGIEPKCHCLNYEPFIPDWAKTLDIEEYKSELENRIKQIAERYGDTICEFEVMNEIFQKKKWETPVRKDVVWSFKTSRKYLKNNKLIINDGQNVWDDYANGNLQYYNLIKQSLENGAPIDCIGVQSHIMWCSKTSLYPENLWGFYEKYSELSLPFSITEVTVPSNVKGVQDESVQAEFLKCLYSLWFGVKGMESIIYWNLINGYAHGATPGDMTVGENVHSGGLLNFDTSKRPSYYALNELINKEWKTNLELGSNDFGIVNFNGFFGKYEISAFINGKKESAIVNLTRQNNLQEIYLK